MKNTPQVAVIGAGKWGSNLVRVFEKLGALKYVCDTKYEESRLEEAGGKYKYNKEKYLTDYHRILSNQDIDAVVIATPPETHYEIAYEALKKDKHIFVEKPFVLDIADGERILDLVELNSSKLVLMVGHVMQYHPTFRMLKQIIRDGELGDLLYIYSNRLNLGRVRRNENALWSFAPHDISMILKLAGEEPVSVYSTGGNYLHNDIADVTMTHLEFKTGLKAHIFVSWLHPFKEQKMVVVGSEKMAVFDDTLQSENKLCLYRHKIDSNGDTTRGEKEYAVAVKSEPLMNECKHFLDCIRTGRKPLTDGEEAMRVLRVLKQAQESLDGGKP